MNTTKYRACWSQENNADHWNRINFDEEPKTIQMDFMDDIHWRKNAPDDDEEAV